MSFDTASDSPVKADSSILREATSNNRKSAATTSPASNSRMSPGTS